MKYREAFFEASIRSGEPRERVQRKFEWIVLNAKLPPNWNDEIPAGEEEKEIARQMGLKRKAEAAPFSVSLIKFLGGLREAADNRRSN